MEGLYFSLAPEVELSDGRKMQRGRVWLNRRKNFLRIQAIPIWNELFKR